MAKFKVDVYLPAASHMEYFEEEVEMTWKQALRLWFSTKFSPRFLLYVEDRVANNLLEKLLREQQPQYQWSVEGCLGIKHIRPVKKEKNT